MLSIERNPNLSRNPWTNEIFAAESLESIDRKFLPGTKQEINFIISEFDLTPGSSLLDLGCGAGRHTIELAKAGYIVTGIDISETMLQEAKNRAKEESERITFINIDLLGLGNHFNGQKEIFAGAICICESGLGVLDWEKELVILRAIHNLLKDRAKLILTTFNGLRKYRGERINARSFDFLNGTVRWELPDDWHGGEKLSENQRVYIPSEMKMICEIAGFSSTEIYGCKPGDFNRNQLDPDDIEMMVICKK
jgi:SAM-dependent methyltransferase